jgi:phosphatidylserine/phosphatidylglycerophosphate/cardiolipin synthase-like enzyme
VTKLPRTGRRAPRILAKGVTCWRIAPADRVAVLIDAAAYYRALLDAFRRARWCIMILGWDFDPGVRLEPTDPATELRRLLPELVERRPQLQVRLLIWDVAVVYGPSNPVHQLLEREWQAHPRVQLRFDGQHPFGAAHHEKLVCIDDALAFAGGIDLTVKRWDTPAHDPADPRRRHASGESYDPVHDLQITRPPSLGRSHRRSLRGRPAGATPGRIRSRPG